MIRFILILTILFSCFGILKPKAQSWVNVTNEYIENPSFEDYDTCPTITSAYPNEMWIDLAVKSWYTPTQATSDYFNACNSNMYPCSFVHGCQPAYHGNAFCGILTQEDYQDSLGNFNTWSEYIATQLIKPLKNNTLYRFSMEINRADGYFTSVKYLGAHFSEVNLTNMLVTVPFNFQPTVINENGFLNDSIDWISIKGEFLANGEENFLTIGWFGDRNSDDYFTEFINPPEIDTLTGEVIFNPQTYYLIDFLQLYELSYDIEQFNVNVLSLNNDSVNDLFDLTNYGLKELDFVVLNRWGNIVYESKNPQMNWDGKDKQGNVLNDGVYFYKLNAIHNSGKHVFKSNFLTILN